VRGGGEGYVPPEKHNRARIVDFVHCVEILYGFVVDGVDDCEVLDQVGDLVQVLVHGHAFGVCVRAEAQDDETLFFGEDGLVDVPG